MKTQGSNVCGRMNRAAEVGALVLIVLMTGCSVGGKRDSAPAGSGNPEADRRAEQRVDKDEKGGKQDRTLYERLGGEAGIRAVVDDSTTRFLADPRVNFERRNLGRTWFRKSYKPWSPTPENVEQFKHHMVEFLTLAAGGPPQYTGRDIGEAHRGMRITNNEFDAMVGDIKASMDKLGTAPREQKELLAIVETTRKAIVEGE